MHSQLLLTLAQICQIIPEIVPPLLGAVLGALLPHGRVGEHKFALCRRRKEVDVHGGHVRLEPLLVIGLGQLVQGPAREPKVKPFYPEAAVTK